MTIIIKPEMVTKAAADSLEKRIRELAPDLRIDRTELNGLKLYVLDPRTLSYTIACQPHTDKRDGFVKTAEQVVRQLRGAR